MNIQYYDGKNMQWLEPVQKYELDTNFLIDAWKEAQKSNSESFFEWALLCYKKKFNLQKAVIFLGVDGFKKICGDDILTLKSFFRLSQKSKHIIASNKISHDPRNKTKSLTGKCIQYPFILGSEVVGSIVYYRKEEADDFSQEEICKIAGPYSKYMSGVLMDWHNKHIKFGTEMWEFINVMSHEMRTPLNGISGMTQLLMDTGENLTQVQWRYLQILQDSNIHLLGLVNDMIDYSKLQYKQTALRKESFSLAGLVTQSKDILNDSKSHQIIITHKKPNYDLLLGDKSKMLQIFINLLSNAMKYSKEGSQIKITTDVTFPKDGLSNLEYTIEDSGVGMSENNLSKIFEPFYRIESTTKLKPGNGGGGMGLGLSIISEILKHLGGKISVKSVVDKGTTFHVEVPVEVDNVFDDWYKSKKELLNKLNIVLFIVDKNVRESYTKLFDSHQLKYTVEEKVPDLKTVDVLITDTYDYSLFKNNRKTNILNSNELQPIRNVIFPHIVEQSTVRIPKKNLKTLRVLLVEDDTNNTFYLQEILKGMGLDSDQVNCKVCRKDALQDISQEDYDIYLLDMKLPDGEGTEIAKTIQRTKKGNYKIIGMTAGVQKPNSGIFDNYLTKPLKRNTLANILKEYFKPSLEGEGSNLSGASDLSTK